MSAMTTRHMIFLADIPPIPSIPDPTGTLTLGLAVSVLAVTVGILLVASAVSRGTARLLRSRSSYDVLAHDEYDPAPAEVAGHALRLHGARGGLAGRALHRRATAIRVRLSANGRTGMLRYGVDCPESGFAVLESSLRQTGPVDLVRRELDEDHLDPDDLSDDDLEDVEDVEDVVEEDATDPEIDFIDLSKETT